MKYQIINDIQQNHYRVMMAVTLRHAITGNILGKFETTIDDTIFACKKYLRKHVSIMHNYKFFIEHEHTCLISPISPNISVLYTNETSTYMRIEYDYTEDFKTINARACIYDLFTGSILSVVPLKDNYIIIGFLFEQIIIFCEESNQILAYDTYEKTYKTITNTDCKPLSCMLLKNGTLILNETERVTQRDPITFKIIKILSLANKSLYCIGVTLDDEYVILASKDTNRIFYCQHIETDSVIYSTTEYDYRCDYTSTFPLVMKYLIKETDTRRSTKFIDIKTLEVKFIINKKIFTYCTANDRDILVTVSLDNKIQIWNTLEPSKPACTISNIVPTGVFFTSDDNILIVLENSSRTLYKTDDLMNGIITIISEYPSTYMTLGFKSFYTFLSNYRCAFK